MSKEYKRNLILSILISLLITVLIATAFSFISDRINQQGVDNQLIFQPTNPTVFDFVIWNMVSYVTLFILLTINLYYMRKFGLGFQSPRTKRFYILFGIFFVSLFIPLINNIILIPLEQILDSIPCYRPYCSDILLNRMDILGLYPDGFFGWVVSIIYVAIISYTISWIGSKESKLK